MLPWLAEWMAQDWRMSAGKVSVRSIPVQVVEFPKAIFEAYGSLLIYQYGQRVSDVVSVSFR